MGLSKRLLSFSFLNEKVVEIAIMSLIVRPKSHGMGLYIYIYIYIYIWVGERGGESHQISTHVIYHKCSWSILFIMNFPFFNNKNITIPLVLD